MRSLLDAVKEYGPAVPIEVIWAANRMTPLEIAEALEADRLAYKCAIGEAIAHDADEKFKLMRHLALQAGVPKRYATGATDSRFLTRLESGRGLYIQGSLGTGKTTMAAAILRSWIDVHGATAKFVTVPAFISDLKQAAQDRRGEDAVITAFATTKLLVLDDIGKEAPTAWVLSKLFDIVDRRWSAMLPTIFTSQYSLSELAEHLSFQGDIETAQAIVSRIGGTCEVIGKRGPDMRIAQRK